VRLPRSYLYVPGNSADKLAKAPSRGSDALIIDLEDAVPPSGKDDATSAVVDWLAVAPTDGPQLWVRVNSEARRCSDVTALAGLPALTGIVLAKVRDADEVAEVASLLDERSDRATLLMPLLETASAILDARALATAPRVHQLQVGEADLSVDAGIIAGDDEAEMAPLRSAVVLASAAAGIYPPVGPVSRETRDLEGLATATRRIRRLGFFGRACIHPAQLGVVHEVFTPSRDEVAEAHAVIDAFNRASAIGSGVALDAEGRMIDKAVLRAAQRTVASVRDMHRPPSDPG
jgi:citrate lyase subunit beta/citryl-CoA lyase